MTFYDVITYIYFALLLASLFITSRIYQYKQIPLYLKLFPPFLLLTLVVEFTGYVQIIRKMIRMSIFIYPVIALLNIFFIQGFDAIHTYTLFLGALLIIVACSTYLLEVLRKDELGTAIHYPSFWICAGLMFFYTVYIPIIAAFALPQAYEIFNTNIISALQVFPNYLLYSLYTFGFISFYRLQRVQLAQPGAPRS